MSRHKSADVHVKKSEGEKKKPKPPFRKSFDLTLPSGQAVKVTISHTQEQVEVPCKYQNGVRTVRVPGPANLSYTLPRLHRLKNNGKNVTAKLTVPGVRLSIRYQDGQTVVARACCKPPDVFNAKIGLKEAARRIFAADSGIVLGRFQPAHIGTIEEKVKGDKKVKKTVWVKGGKPVVDTSVKPRLNGEDRKELMAAVIRGGPRKSKKTTQHEQQESASEGDSLAVG